MACELTDRATASVKLCCRKVGGREQAWTVQRGAGSSAGGASSMTKRTSRLLWQSRQCERLSDLATVALKAAAAANRTATRQPPPLSRRVRYRWYVGEGVSETLS